MRPPIFLSPHSRGFLGASVSTVVAGSPLGLLSKYKGESHDSKSTDKRQGVFAFVGGIREGLTEE